MQMVGEQRGGKTPLSVFFEDSVSAAASKAAAGAKTPERAAVAKWGGASKGAVSKAGTTTRGPPGASPPRCRLIFLDVDGVLHPLSEKGFPAEADLDDVVKRAEEQEALPPGAPLRVCAGEFLPRCMSVLQRMVAEAGADIVLSSTWRESTQGVRAVNAQLAQHRMRPVLGTTPVLSHLHPCRRAQEIHAFLEIHASSAKAARGCCSFVVLDDDDLLGDEARHKSDCEAGATAAAREASERPEEVDKIVGVVRPHFVRVDRRTGLTEEDRVRSLSILLNEEAVEDWS